jgi:acetylornithine deacetylase/succinyl-diaminopimelate desuccinylase-like protein
MLRAACGLLAAFAATQVCAANVRDYVEGYRIAHESQIVGQLDELTRIRSVAADPAGLAAAADRLESLLKERGFETKLLSPGTGAPSLVFGYLRSPGARRTVVFYAHYDGQPVTPSEWKSDPFIPVMRSGPLNSGGHDIDLKAARSPFNPEWRLFGRAASDDKASIVAFLAAFDALKASGRKTSVNIKVAWEGEEEVGSPHLAQILRENQTLLASDLWLIGDGPLHQSRRGPVALLPMMGASVPIYLFADIFKVPVIGLPIVNHDNNQHAANENLRLQNLWDGIETYAAMLAALSW